VHAIVVVVKAALRVLIAEYLSFQPALPDKIDKRRNLGIYKPVFARQVEEERRLVG
jgi:hypothetical protein